MTFKWRSFVVLSMHIAMVSGEYPPRWGGIGSVVFHLAGHLAQRGHGAEPSSADAQTADAATTRRERSPGPLAQSTHGVHPVLWKARPHRTSSPSRGQTGGRRSHAFTARELDGQGIPLGGRAHRPRGFGAQRQLDRGARGDETCSPPQRGGHVEEPQRPRHFAHWRLLRQVRTSGRGTLKRFRCHFRFNTS